MSAVKYTTKRSARHRASARVATKKKQKPTNTTGIAVAILGWVVALVAAGYMVSVRQEMKKARGQLKVEYKEDIAALQGMIDRRQQVIRDRMKNLTDGINAENKRQAALQGAIATLEAGVPELEERQRKLAKEVSTLEEEVARLRDEAGLTGESRATILAKLRQAQARRDELKRSYIEGYYQLKEQYMRLRAAGTAQPMQQFFYNHRESPFAPAAAYQAAEFHRMDRKREPALRLYQEIVKNYSDSGYAYKAESKTKMLEDSAAGWSEQDAQLPRFEPYKKLSIVN